MAASQNLFVTHIIAKVRYKVICSVECEQSYFSAILINAPNTSTAGFRPRAFFRVFTTLYFLSLSRILQGAVIRYPIMFNKIRTLENGPVKDCVYGLDNIRRPGNLRHLLFHTMIKLQDSLCLGGVNLGLLNSCLEEEPDPGVPVLVPLNTLKLLVINLPVPSK